MTARQAQRELRKRVNKTKAAFFPKFFKTGKGEYGEGDRFIGVTVPNTRLVARQFRELPAQETLKLLRSPIHEERLLALLIWVRQFTKGDEATRKKIYDLYLKNRKYVNNWDLVDTSAPHICGAYLNDKDRSVLRKLARSKNLWDRRIAMLSTFYFIRQGDFKDALAVANLLVRDSHDLIQKAVGWMLREIGQRDLAVEDAFLKKHAAHMPRTMLRYAIEKLPKFKRSFYLMFGTKRTSRTRLLK